MARLSRLGLATKPSALRRIIPLRSYGSAAAVQYDYEEDYCYSEQEEEAASGRLPGLNEPCQGLAAGSTWGRGVQWVLIGEPGDKRRLYAEKLAKLLEVPHISMGSLLRQELNPGSSLYKQIANAVNEGKLVPEGVIFGLLSKRLEEGYYREESGFILDGIPRTRIQAEILDQIADIDLAVNFKSAEENVVKRDFLRMGNSKSSIGGMENALKEKSRIYLEQGKALEDYYRKQKKLLDFQVGGAPGDAWQGLLAALHLKHLSAVNSTKKLTA